MKRMLRTAARKVLSLAFRPVYAGTGCILALHRVAEKTEAPRLDNPSLEISPASLDSLIQHLLSRNYAIISMDEVHARLTTQEKGKRFAAFTFDDGYLDNYTLALPIFKKYQVPFAVYIPTSFVGNTNAFWWYRLEHLLLHQSQLSFLNEGKRHEMDLGSYRQKMAAFDFIGSLIRGTGPRARQALLQDLFAEEKEFHRSNLVMNWEQIKELAGDDLVTIGAHSVHHFDLNKLTSEEILFEINESRRVLESKIGRKVEHFSYPFGGRNSVNQREFALAKSCGFKTVVTTRMGNVFPEHAQYLECLPRLLVGDLVPIIPLFQALESGVLNARSNHFKRVVTT